MNRKTRSAEHILPNSIGGKRKAYNLLCKSCNETFGRSIDNELASKLNRFYSLLTTQEPALQPGARKDGKIIVHDRFIAEIKKSHSFSGSPGYFRSIAKICLNFYLTKGYSRQYCETIKSYIRGDNASPPCFYYAPENETVHSLAENEVSHILHLHGSKSSGALYAYIELFNMQNLIFVFTMDYEGNDIDTTYCRNLISDEEPSKKIALGLTRAQLEELAVSSEIMEKRLYPPFERLLQIIRDRQH
ncbi:MAG: hypothetical protein J7578_17600 [Chitinophagaceae bacterium]|nr:hypothetical protein [Chitinophagaceae bacterium]